MTPDPYVRLGVSRTATVQEITVAYRRLAQRWHPDRNADPQASVEFLAVQAAYHILRDPQRRADWDRRQAAPKESTFQAEAPRWTDRFRQPHVRRPRPPGLPGDHAHVQVRVTLVSVMRPQQVLVHYQRAHTCPQCEGQTPHCPLCGGTGQRFGLRTLRVNLPAGVHEGQILRVPGEGHDGPRFSQPGDLWIGVSWARAGRWRWREGRLETRYRQSRTLARHGGVLRIKGPDGVWGTIPIPALSKGTWVRVLHLGLPLPHATARDDAWIELV